jgi:hypothetical protein
VAISPDELPGLLAGIRDRVAAAAPEMAMAMGRVHEGYVKDVTLVQHGQHGPATPAGYPPAAPRGESPAMMTGRLRSSITCVMGQDGGAVASSLVSPHVIYAKTQEFGGVHSGDMWLWVKYVGPNVVEWLHWRRRVVDIGPHPYMRPSRDDVIRNGSVTGAANASFMRQVWG